MCEEDNIDIVAGSDLEIAWTTNNYIPICQNDFNSSLCGTFLEIHMPGNTKILEQYKLTKYLVNGFSTVFLPTKNLCAGRYELWYVSRIRDDVYLNHVKPFYVSFPSCSCDYIKNYNPNFKCQ
jgi:hypothetical protein